MRVWTNRDIETNLLKLLPDTIAAGSLNEPGSRAWFFSANPDKTSGIDRDMGMEISGWDASNPTINFRLFTADDDKGKWGNSFELPCDPTAEEIDGVDWNAIAEYIKGYILDGKNESSNPNKREESMLSIKTHNKFESKVESQQAAAPAPKKSEATAFGAGMSKRKDFTKARNLGDVLEALEKHRDFLQAKSEDLTQSKEDLQASIAKLKEFSAHVDFLKQQSVKGIKDAISFNKSPEVKAAADVEQQLKDALKILYSDYSNIPDVTQLLTVLDSRYATTGDKVVTSWIDNANRAISVDAKTVKDSISDGLLSEDDVVKLITVTSVQHGVKNKDTVEKVGPVLARMNALLETAPKLEEAVIDPKQFKELRDLVEQIVEEASAPKDIIKTTISSITKDELGKIKPLESKMVEGLLDKLKQMVSALSEKISALWDSFTSAFFGLEDEALESAEVFNEVEETLGYTGIQMESRIVKEETLGKKMEVLTKSVLTCCDKLVKDASLPGEFDDEVIYAEEAVKNAIESFQNLGEACKSLKSALSYHKNENNMDVIGILADAITQIVADDSGETEGGEEGSEEEDDSVVGQVEREYAPNGGPEHRELPTSEPVAAPNPAGAEEPEEF